MTIPVIGERFQAANVAINDFRELGKSEQITAKLESLHDLVLGVCPDCLIEHRREPVLIYVLPGRADQRRDKNLMTVWLDSGKMQIIEENVKANPPHNFDPEDITEYRRRLHAVKRKLRAHVA